MEACLLLKSVDAETVWSLLILPGEYFFLLSQCFITRQKAGQSACFLSLEWGGIRLEDSFIDSISAVCFAASAARSRRFFLTVKFAFPELEFEDFFELCHFGGG